MTGRPIGTGTNGRRRYLTDAELSAFLKAADRAGKKWSAFWALAYFYAMRVCETSSLKLGAFDFNSHQVTIKGAKGGQTRVYDLDEKVEKKVQAWLKARAKDPDHGENEHVFPSKAFPRTGCLGEGSAWHAFRRTAGKAGIGPHSPHDLRHTRASEMVRAGDTQLQVARWLRHKSSNSAETYMADMSAAAHEREMAKRAAKYL
jgi:integrase